MYGVIFFDGVCNLCNGVVDFLIRMDKKRIFRYAPLQSQTAKEMNLISTNGKDPDSIILLYNEQLYRKSDAVLKIALLLQGAWRIFVVFYILPGNIRDKLYDFIASRRYKWFGKRDSCRTPTEEEAQLFLK